MRTAILLTCAGLLAAQASAANFSGTAKADSGTSSIAGPPDHKTKAGPTPVALDASSSQLQQSGETATGFGSSNASTSALAGLVRLRAEASGSAGIVARGQMGGRAQSSAAGSVDDSFVINLPGCTNQALCGAGRTGLLSFAAIVNGQVGGGGDADTTGTGVTAGWSGGASWQSDVRLDAGYIAGVSTPTSMRWNADRSLTDSASAGPRTSGSGNVGRQVFSASFRFGAPISLHLAGTLEAHASALVQGADLASANASAGFLGDLSHTIAWGGILEVHDTAGNLLSGYTALSSATGYDYRLAAVSQVPEPAALWLALCGIVALGLRRRLR